MILEMMNLFREWVNNNVQEISDPSYQQDLYRLIAVLTISKGVGGDKTETQNEIRSIPNITTVTLEQELSDEPGHFVGEYSIKIALEKGEGLKDYIRRIFKPEIKRIDGLKINIIKKIEKIEKGGAWGNKK